MLGVHLFIRNANNMVVEILILRTQWTPNESATQELIKITH